MWHVTFPMFLTWEQIQTSNMVQQAARDHLYPGENEAELDTNDLFLGLTLLAMPVYPEQDIGQGTAGTGVCLFYAPGSEEDPNWLVPWTCTVDVGASASYRFEKIGDASQGFNESDSEPWQQRTLDLLQRSVWVLVRGPGAQGGV